MEEDKIPSNSKGNEQLEDASMQDESEEESEAPMESANDQDPGDSDFTEAPKV
jgi:hypothetical protein